MNQLAYDGSSRAAPWRGRLVRRTLVILLLLAIAHRAAGLQGLVRPMRVSESSMVPYLLGEHAVVRCPACRRSYAIEPFDPSADDLRAVCARCGALHLISLPVQRRRGERVLIQSRWLPPVSRLRWRAVALRDPNQPDEWLVKRVVGLPGESVELRDGDLLVNGRRASKTLAELRQMAIPVCDTRDVNAAAEEAAWIRWQPASQPSAWRAKRPGYESRPEAVEGWSWLAFQPTDVAGRRGSEMLLLDDYPFNQSLSRQLHPVRDLLLRCELSDFQSGQVACRVQVGGETVQVAWDRSGGWFELQRSGLAAERRRVELPATVATSGVLWELAVCDGVLHFALGGQSQLTAPLPAAMTRSGASVERLELGARRARVRLQRVELLRDIYYLAAPQAGVIARDASGHATVLGSDELFVLGDNSPVSEDSRNFGPVHRSQLLGTLVRWPLRGR